MGSLSCRERARRALDAMKALGFSRKEATPVLRSLLKLFDDAWEPIEDEGYRALADAVLDARARPQNGVKQEHCTPHGDPRGLEIETGPPRIKRPRTSSADFAAEHSVHPQLPVPTMGAQDDIVSALRQLNRPQTRAPIRSRQDNADGMPSSAPAHTRAKQMLDEDFHDAVFLREPKPEPDMDDGPSWQNVQVGIISHPLNTSSPVAADPPMLPPPDSDPSKILGVKGKTIQHYRTRAASTSLGGPMNSKQHQNQKNALDHTAATPDTRTGKTQEVPSPHAVVASSTMGEVKMLIKCSIDPSKFHMPDLKTVFKMVEDKCRHSFKILPPNFSVGSLINEICQCVAELGNGHTAEQNIQSDAFDNGRNSQNESVTSSAPCVEPIACMNSRIGNCKAVEESLTLECSENGPPYSNVPQQPCLALPCPRPTHDISDISKG